MNYEELKESIKSTSSVEDWIRDYECIDVGYETQICNWRHTALRIASIAYEAGKVDYETEKLSDNWHAGFKEGYEAAAKNTKAWYVFDKNSERVHIGDIVKGGLTGENEVIGLGNECIFLNIIGLVKWDTESCEKVIHDTRKKIRFDLANLISEIGNIEEWPEGKTSRDLAEEFICRVEALNGDA